MVNIPYNPYVSWLIPMDSPSFLMDATNKCHATAVRSAEPAAAVRSAGMRDDAPGEMKFTGRKKGGGQSPESL